MTYDLKESFTKLIVDWAQKLNEDEWLFCNFRDEITSKLTQEDAFILIPDAVQLIFEQKDPYLYGECFEILMSLVRMTKTTEMHPLLLHRWCDLEKLIVSLSEYYSERFKDIKKWYRKQ